MNVSVAKVTPLNMSLHHATTTRCPPTPPQCCGKLHETDSAWNAARIAIDLGGEEEKWRERERGREVRTGGEGRTADG